MDAACHEALADAGGERLDMTHSSAPEQTAQRVDRLLRSLVGIVDVCPVWEGARLRSVHVLKDGVVPEPQLIRNAVSGLKAGLGVVLDGSVIRIYGDTAAFGRAVEGLRATDGSTPAERPAPLSKGKDPGAAVGSNGSAADTADPVVPATPPANGTARALAVTNGAANGNGTRSRAVPRSVAGPSAGVQVNDAHPAHDSGIQLERLELERYGAMLRCRVILALEGHKYSAIAEAPDGPAAEAELAAKVTLDALRAGALTSARLDGIGFSKVGDTTYLLAAVRESSAGRSRASASPLIDSMARSAAEAVLGVVGPITASHQKTAERTLGRL
jgi:hypothetical protein